MNAAGTYGLALEGLEGVDHLTGPADSTWPTVVVEVEQGDGSAVAPSWAPERAAFRIGADGAVSLDRTEMSAHFTMPTLPAAEHLIHPHFAVSASVFSHWLGRLAVHAGAIEVGGKAWLILGEKEAGKSSLLASCVSRDVSLVSDDIAVVDGGAVFSGPRCIDLRRGAAEALRLGRPMGTVGIRERWRVYPASSDPLTPLGGWVRLAWDDDVRTQPIPVRDRLSIITQNLAIVTPPENPEALLDLAATPSFELRRPRDWRAMDDAVDALLEVIS